MIGPGLKKYAKQHNMTIENGIAYGSLHGYAVSLYEGNGWKAIDVACLFPDGQKMAQLMALLDDSKLQKEYRITELTLTPNGIFIRFYDNPGTMKRIIAFADRFLPQLSEYGATGADICPRCGLPHDSGSRWYVIDGSAARLHRSCAERIRQSENHKARIAEENSAGESYLMGFIGALIGGLLGAVIWGAVLYMGYYASLVGILIGLLASKGYDMLRGKQKKGKIVILLLITILSVIIGTLGAYEFELIRAITVGELPGFYISDTPWMLLSLLADPTFMEEVLRQIAAGLLYALIGVSVILLRVHKETKAFKMKELT